MSLKRKSSREALNGVADKNALPQATQDYLAGAAKGVRGLFERIAGSGKPDPSDPVINGATQVPKSFLRGIIADLASQSERWGENIGLLASLVDTKFLDGGVVDDKSYQMEKIIQLASSLPAGSKALDDLSHNFIKVLWENTQHPPLSVLGDDYKYRMADGSNNNLKYPNLGKAGSNYARTIVPRTLKPGMLPEPGVVFDAVLARRDEPKEHPNRISSMLFYLATIIIHDVFHTDETDQSRVKTSSYLDLAPLYGSSQEEQDRVRTFTDGLLKPDTFSEGRLRGFPPGVSAIVICFNRYHNFVAKQLKEINENGRFSVPSKPEDKKAWQKLDNDLFQTARLVTCGLYVNIILVDYVRTILNLNRTNSTWTLDPRNNFNDVYDSAGVPSGIGNQVSVEFNLVYRWHSAISVKDEKWVNELYQNLFPGQDLTLVEEKDLVDALRARSRKTTASDPSAWDLDNGKYKRTGNGTFRDEDIVRVLSDATEDVACAFGARQVPLAMKLVETMGMKQARAWNVATLNEFRKFFKLEPHRTFADISSDTQVAHALEALYGHPDYVEMYPGIVVEDAKLALDPGSGLCPGYTISRTILADAVALVRGDRFYTIDYSPASLTGWGFNQVKSDPDVAQGGCFYNLVMRAMPNWYRGNSVYAMYPFTVPDENRKIMEKLGHVQEYSFDRPSFVPVPTSIKTWQGCTDVLKNQADFKVPWGDHTFYLTGQDYMLSGDKPSNANQRKEVEDAIYCPANGLEEVRKFYEALTTQLVEIKSTRLRDEWYQLDACRDVGNMSHAVFVAQLFHIPLKAPGSINPAAVEVDDLYLAFSVLFAYVFLDADTARSFKLRKGAKQSGDQLSKLIKLVCEAVHVGDRLHLDNLFRSVDGSQLLGDYGVHLLRRLFDGGKSVDEVVWEIVPTAAAAVATQAQHFAQMLDLYLSPKYRQHWPDIQRCAWSEDPADFEKLKSYALEANRLAPAAWGLLRRVAKDTTIEDGDESIKVRANEALYTDFVSAGLDPKVFPEPETIKLDRDRDLYIHHGYGPHACVGRRIVEVSMAAQLKVFAKLKNLRRAQGPQSVTKSTVPAPNPVSSDPRPSPGAIRVYMKEDWSDWWPFPTTLKVHHDGFYKGQDQYLAQETGYPGLEKEIAAARIGNDDANGLAPDDETRTNGH